MEELLRPPDTLVLPPDTQSTVSNTYGETERGGAYTVEFRESVNTDMDPFLVDARGGRRRWHRSVFHRRRCGDSHGADGVA